VKSDQSQVATALADVFISPNESDRNFEAANVVDGLFAISRGLHAVAKAITALGNNDAATPMGAVEMLAKEVRDGFRALAEMQNRFTTESPD
jgi:hypothetical protein